MTKSRRARGASLVASGLETPKGLAPETGSPKVFCVARRTVLAEPERDAIPASRPSISLGTTLSIVDGSKPDRVSWLQQNLTNIARGLSCVQLMGRSRKTSEYHFCRERSRSPDAEPHCGRNPGEASSSGDWARTLGAVPPVESSVPQRGNPAIHSRLY
jgi:hypothetical protein